MKIYDISLPVHNDMLVWEGDPGVKIEQKTTVSKHGVALSYFSFGSHTGTHVDAPNHFISSGIGIDAIPLKKLIGKVMVVDLQHITHKEILPSDLQGVPLQGGSRVLFKTGNYKLLKKSSFPQSYISLSLEGAKFLVKRKVDLVGTDFLGIEKKKNPGHPVHTTLLKAGVVIVEGLDLSKVPSGEYQLYCLPLNVVGVDGAPARVILIKD